MLSSLSTFQSLIDYAGSSSSSGPPAIGSLKLSSFVAGTTTLSIVNQYTGTTGAVNGTDLVINTSNLPSIASLAGIVNALQFNLSSVSSSSSVRVQFNGSFNFDSSVAMTISCWFFFHLLAVVEEI